MDRFRGVDEDTWAAVGRVTRRLLSALGADVDSPSSYASSKARGELAVRHAFPAATILRPSIVFGPEDDFFNRFASMARFSPVLPLIGGGQNKFQPVYVGDVAEAVARSVDGKIKGGQVYELGGPQVLTFKECMQELLTVIERRGGKYLVLGLARGGAAVSESG